MSKTLNPVINKPVQKRDNSLKWEAGKIKKIK